METPASIPEEFTPDSETARRNIEIALTAGRHRLNAYETSQVLSAYEIPVAPLYFASTPDAATGSASAGAECAGGAEDSVARYRQQV